MSADGEAPAVSSASPAPAEARLVAPAPDVFPPNSTADVPLEPLAVQSASQAALPACALPTPSRLLLPHATVHSSAQPAARQSAPRASKDEIFTPATVTGWHRAASATPRRDERRLCGRVRRATEALHALLLTGGLGRLRGAPCSDGAGFAHVEDA